MRGSSPYMRESPRPCPVHILTRGQSMNSSSKKARDVEAATTVADLQAVITELTCAVKQIGNKDGVYRCYHPSMEQAEECQAGSRPAIEEIQDITEVSCFFEMSRVLFSFGVLVCMGGIPQLQPKDTHGLLMAAIVVANLLLAVWNLVFYSLTAWQVSKIAMVVLRVKAHTLVDRLRELHCKPYIVHSVRSSETEYELTRCLNLAKARSFNLLQFTQMQTLTDLLHSYSLQELKECETRRTRLQNSFKAYQDKSASFTVLAVN